MPQASQNAALCAARGAALGQPGSRPVISSVAQLTILQRGAKLFNAMDRLFVLGSDGLMPAAVRFMQEQHRP